MTRGALGTLLGLTLALGGCGVYGPPERIRKPAEPARSEAQPSEAQTEPARSEAQPTEVQEEEPGAAGQPDPTATEEGEEPQP